MLSVSTFPPEGPPTGTDLVTVPPGIHQGSLHPAVHDFGDILTTMGEVMQNQSAANLNLAIDNIAKLLKPKFDATGPAENLEEKEVQSIEDAEMVSQVLPGLKYMDERMRAPRLRQLASSKTCTYRQGECGA